MTHPVYCSVSELDDRWFVVRYFWEARNISSLQSDQTSCGVHTRSCWMSNLSVPQSCRGMESSIHPHLVSRLRMSVTMRLLPLRHLWHGQRRLYLLCTSVGLLLKRRVSSLVLEIVTAGVTSRCRITFCVFIWQCNNVTTLNWCRIPSLGNVWLWSSISLTAGGV
jgi:hypothetical protein